MKDYYNFLLCPSKREIKKENTIERLFGIYELHIPNTYNCLSQNYRNDSVTNTALITWNNEVLNIKLVYVTSIKYYKKYLRTKEGLKKEAYEYWCRKNLEQTIIELSNLYDKSLHIINAMYNLKVNIGTKFEYKIFEELTKSDDIDIKNISHKYLKVKKDFHLYKPQRNNSVHNFSQLFSAFEIKDNRWIYRQGISLEETYTNIENIVNILEEQKAIIESELKRIFNKAEIE